MRTVEIEEAGREPLVLAETRLRTMPMLLDEEANALDPYIFPVTRHATEHTSLPAAYLRHLTNALIFNDVIFCVDEFDNIIPHPSSWRSIDRDVRGDDFLAKASANFMGSHKTEIEAGIYIGSSGSSNYGHWLVDDLPRGLLACSKLKREPLLITSFSLEIDSIKSETLRLSHSDRCQILIPNQSMVKVRNLYFMDPISVHPILKSKEAILLLRRQYDYFDYKAIRHRIFVSRRNQRKLSNYQDLEIFLRQNNIKTVYAEDFCFADQVRLFANAELVIGIMGAAMTNVIFCNLDTQVLFLAPSGWHEPFYWDLCDTIGLKYNVMYGNVTHGSERVHLSDFEIKVEPLSRALFELFSFAIKSGNPSFLLTKPAETVMERFEVVQSVLEMFEKPRYLEIGVNEGRTFHSLIADKKVGVDPNYLFDIEEARSLHLNNQYIVQTSDDFFSAHLDMMEKFDVIFIDGLHTFDQVLKDLLNSYAMLKDDGIIIIDDVIPRDFISSLPSIEMMYAMRQAENSGDTTWMGDVYKLVFFISGFLPALSFATVKENHGQTLCWKKARNPESLAIKDVTNLDFTDVALRKSIYNIQSHSDILRMIQSDRDLRLLRENKR